MLPRVLVRSQLNSVAVFAATLLAVPRTLLKDEDSTTYVSM